MDIPNWIQNTTTENLIKYLNDPNKRRGCRERTRLAIEEELKIREGKIKRDETSKNIILEETICKTNLNLFRGVAVENEQLTEEVKNKLKSNNLTWYFNKKIRSYVVGLNIAEIQLKNEEMMIPELDDLDLVVKLVTSGIQIESNPHTYILSKV